MAVQTYPEPQADLRRALERAAFEWRSTFDALGLPIVIADFGGTVRRVNRAAQALLGADYRDIIGRPVAELGAGQPWAGLAALVHRLLRTAEPAVCETRDEGGSTWELEACLSGGPAPEDARVIVQVRDVSRTVKLQESLRRSETMAVLGGIVGGVAHEVRNPLFGITAVLDAFEARHGERAEYRQYMPLLRTEVARLLELMQALLDYGRPPRPALLPGEIGEAVARALCACQPLAVRRDVALVVDLAGGGQPVLLDRSRLSQALKNVIENAVQHSPPAGEVKIETAPVTLAGEPWIRLRVTDRGPGFRPADLPQVFEPFYSRRAGGTGLGLSIVARVVDEHGGRVRAGNRPSGGGLVELELPVVRDGRAGGR